MLISKYSDRLVKYGQLGCLVSQQLVGTELQDVESVIYGAYKKLVSAWRIVEWGHCFCRCRSLIKMNDCSENGRRTTKTPAVQILTLNHHEYFLFQQVLRSTDHLPILIWRVTNHLGSKSVPSAGSFEHPEIKLKKSWYFRMDFLYNHH